jgi:hypothetical protein
LVKRRQPKSLQFSFYLSAVPALVLLILMAQCWNVPFSTLAVIISMANTDLPLQNPQLSNQQPIIDELVGTIATDDVKQRLRILQRVTDLFMAGSRGYSDRQIALFDDVRRRSDWRRAAWRAPRPTRSRAA